MVATFADMSAEADCTGWFVVSRLGSDQTICNGRYYVKRHICDNAVLKPLVQRLISGPPGLQLPRFVKTSKQQAYAAASHCSLGAVINDRISAGSHFSFIDGLVSPVMPDQSRSAVSSAKASSKEDAAP